MKIKIIAFYGIALGILFGISSLVLATTDAEQIAQLKAETKTLEKQLLVMQRKLDKLQHAQKSSVTKVSSPVKTKQKVKVPTDNTEVAPIIITDHDKYVLLKAEEANKILTAIRYAHGLAVVVSPFLGARDIYDNADLIVNLPSLNTDLHLLEQKQRLDEYAAQHHEIIPDRPMLDVSGGIEAQAFTNKFLRYSNTPANPIRNTDIDLTRAELDLVASVAEWGTGEMIINYESLQSTASALPTSESRVTNSRLKIDRAFITIGNLLKCPVYSTIGQIYVPFGIYNNAYVTDPLTKTLGRIKERVASLAFSKNGFYGSVYAFQGDSYTNRDGFAIDNWGANLGYKINPVGGFNTEVGIGFVDNIADSEGLQAAIFGDQPGTPDSEQLRTRVPAVDAYLSFNYKPLTILGEYLTATHPFSSLDMSYNNHGAKPSAMDAEAIYNFDLFSFNTNIAVGYGHSWQTLAMELPQQSVFAVFSTSLWKYTIESLEFRHNINFPFNDVASFGSPTTMLFPSGNFSAFGARNVNQVTFQVGLYF